MVSYEAVVVVVLVGGVVVRVDVVAIVVVE